MPKVHPTAILDGEIDLADDVTVGPGCVLTGRIAAGAGTTLIGNVYLNGPLSLGEANVVYPFACLGFAPQHSKFDLHQPGPGLVIGNGNTFREHVTVHRAFDEHGPTTIGHRNFFMAGSHAGHDCHVGNDCTLVNNAALGGHVLVQDRVTVGGGTVIHQFCRLGRGAMLSGGVATSIDVPPWFMLTGINVCGSINLIGLRRSGASRDEIEDVRWAYRIICREGLSLTGAIDKLRERGDRPLVGEYIDFLATSERGIATARPRPSRALG